jgi:hypothetical protein
VCGRGRCPPWRAGARAACALRKPGGTPGPRCGRCPPARPWPGAAKGYLRATRRLMGSSAASRISRVR